MREPARILLVEDNQLDIELTLDAFRRVRLMNEIQPITTGEEALQFLLGEGQYHDRVKYPLPHIILLDLQLPGISGNEILARIKKTPLVARIPVIVLTSSSEEGDRARAYDNGVNSYLVKPISFAKFLEVVKQIADYWLTLNVEPPH